MNARLCHRRRGKVRRIAAYVEKRIPVAVLERLAGPLPPPSTDRARFQALMRRVFGLGLTPWVVQRRWPATLEALHDGDPRRVAALEANDMVRFLARPDVIRNGNKLAAVRHNAGVVLALGGVYGDLAAYARAASADGLHELLADLQSRFRLVGPISAARFAQELGIDVIVPHPSVVRLLSRLGWLTAPGDTAQLQQLAAELVRPESHANPRGRMGATLLAFATGRWSVAAVCGRVPVCDSCPVKRGCPRAGVEEAAA